MSTTITGLPAGTTPGGTEVVPADQGGSTVKIALSQIATYIRNLFAVTPVTVAEGGTGATTAAAARTNLGALGIADSPGAPYVDTNPVVKGSADATKQIRFEVDGLTSGTTRVLTVADRDSAIGKSPTRQVFTTGTAATYTTPAGATYINVRMVGGGGGGGGATANNGTAGNATTFGGSLTASGGAGGIANGAGAAAAGGAASGGDINIPGGAGGFSVSTGAAGVVFGGGYGGNSAFGGAGAGQANGAGTSAAANSGSGGAGGGNNAVANAGGGGGAGGYVEKLISTPAATYTYTVGAVANGGAAGGTAGGNGAAGIIIVDEYYN